MPPAVSKRAKRRLTTSLPPERRRRLPMHVERAFRLLDHVTLAAAGVCLIYAEQLFLPALPVCLVPFFGLVLAASWSQGRWVLPDWAANVLGVLIGAATTAWLVLQLRTPGVWGF